MINSFPRRESSQLGVSDTDAVQHYLTWTLGLVCLALLFVNLGSADFFEPDEGRNAEKAREILLLNDWVTPHENFLPVLDKPIFFYWLVALAYKIFGIGEWSARLPSTISALGCLVLVYRFARQWWGAWEAMWSVLILLTSAKFFLLARIVISDVTLTFCVTLALCSFYSALHAKNEKTKTIHCLLLYGALGTGTLVKGLVAVIIPGMVGFVYLLLTHQWSTLRKLNLLPGAILFLVIVVPWYFWVDARNPGYLRYYFWDDHLARYLTDEFDRTESWFYFFPVVAVGFLPWTLFLPLVVKDSWKKFDDKNIFLILWVVLPFLFFSASNSKLAHYVLPIYPALALLSGQMIAARLKRPESKQGWLLYLPWIGSVAVVFYLLIGGIRPHLLPIQIRASVDENLAFIGFCAAGMAILFGALAWADLKGYRRSQVRAYVCTWVGLALFLCLLGQLMVTVSVSRSAKELARNAAPFITQDSRIAIYDTHLPGLLFYLRLDRPIWIVSSLGKTTFMGSPYVSKHFPNPAPGVGKILFNIDQFAEVWKKTKQPVLVFAKAKNISRFEDQMGEGTKALASTDEYILVSRP